MPANKFIFILTVLVTVSFFSSCVPGTDSDDYVEITVGALPLKTGNKWIYEISSEQNTYTDSSEIIGYLPYQLDEITSDYLFLLKEIALYPEMLTLDTLYIKLIKFTGSLLVQYGKEKRDRSHFPYGNSEIFDPVHTLADFRFTAPDVLYNTASEYIESTAAEEVHVNNICVLSGGSEKIISDTLITCIKTRNIYSGGTSYFDLYYDLFIYYSDIGIIQMTGNIQGREFSAVLKKAVLN